MFKQVESDLILREGHGVPLLLFPELARDGRFVHGITTRRGGVSAPPYHSLNLSLSVGDRKDAVQENRERAARSLGLDGALQFRCRQVHGSTVAHAAKCVTDLVTADALVATEPGLTLAMTFADCLPVLLVAPAIPAVGLAHAGWRGSLAGVTVSAWEVLEEMGAGPEDTTAYLGPSIGPCCYEIGADVANEVLALGRSAADCLEERAGSIYLDLARLNAQVLAERGVRVVESHCCTACHTDLLYSHRAERGRTGRFGVYVGLA